MESIKNIKGRAAVIRQHAKTLLVYSLFTAICAGMAAKAEAQTFAEWFSQKKTQKKYLLQQIAALQVYSGYLKKGYGIAKGGLGSISGYLQSEYALHSTFYNRLQTADPVVKNDPMVKDIMDRQQDILKRIQSIRRVSGISATEQQYLANVGQAVLKDCDQQLDLLQNVVNDGKVEMSDQERLIMITRIHEAMQANYRFASGFAAQVKILALKRQQEQAQNLTSKKIYGIN